MVSPLEFTIRYLCTSRSALPSWAIGKCRAEAERAACETGADLPGTDRNRNSSATWSTVSPPVSRLKSLV